jgi:hypothetical protein
MVLGSSFVQVGFVDLEGKTYNKQASGEVNCTLSSRQYKKIKLGNGLSSIFYRAKAIKFGL